MNAIPILFWALGTAIVIGACASILRRIGYSWWYSLLLLVPFINLVALIVVAAKAWPIECELARLRLVAGESEDTNADIESVMSYAIIQEQKRQWDKALSLYNLAASKSSDVRVKQYAEECAQRLIDHQ